MKEIDSEDQILISGGLIPLALALGYVCGVAIGGGTVAGCYYAFRWIDRKLQ